MKRGNVGKLATAVFLRPPPGGGGCDFFLANGSYTNFFVKLEKLEIRYQKNKSAKSKKREHSTLGNYLLKYEFGERRPPHSGGWRVSRRRSRVKTSSASGARRAAAAGGEPKAKPGASLPRSEIRQFPPASRFIRNWWYTYILPGHLIVALW